MSHTNESRQTKRRSAARIDAPSPRQSGDTNRRQPLRFIDALTAARGIVAVFGRRANYKLTEEAVRAGRITPARARRRLRHAEAFVRLFLDELKEFCPRLYAQLATFIDCGVQIRDGVTDSKEQGDLLSADYARAAVTTHYYGLQPSVYDFVTALPVALEAAERLGVDLDAVYPPPKRFQ